MAKTPESKVGAQRARMFKLQFANPISGLTPAKLVNMLNAWNRGDIKAAALAWAAIMERDDQVKTCDGKRRRSVAGLKWEILPVNDSAEAKRHKEALEHFYNNVTAYDGLNQMERGGITRLFKQMMSAAGMRYAVHEIIWKPGAPGGLTADFKFLPLQFFENTEGRLRFLPNDHDHYGKDLDEVFGTGGWMVNCGDGLMFATSILYMFKTPSGFKAWVTWMEKYGVPGLHATTTAAKGTQEWDELVAALTGYGEELALVTSSAATIQPLQAPTNGSPPHPPLVERCDRGISRLWMGGDLATMSAGGQAVGSQPQSDDLEQLKKDDADMITDALQHYVDAQVIRMLFGDVDPLAYFQLITPAKTDTTREIEVEKFLIEVGAPRGKKDLLERFNRPEPDAGDDLATRPAAAPSPFTARPAINESSRAQFFNAAALQKLKRAHAKALAPLVARFVALLDTPDAELAAAAQQLQSDLPAIRAQVLSQDTTGEVAAAWESIIGPALISGAAEAAATQSKAKP